MEITIRKVEYTRVERFVPGPREEETLWVHGGRGRVDFTLHYDIGDLSEEARDALSFFLLEISEEVRGDFEDA